MGEYFVDQYSLLHYAVGVIVYFWGMNLYIWMVLQIAYEYIENTSYGMMLINKYVTMWPGGKNYPDTLTNSIGDIFFGLLGWLTAKLVDHLGTKYEYFRKQFQSLWDLDLPPFKKANS